MFVTVIKFIFFLILIKFYITILECVIKMKNVVRKSKPFEKFKEG